MSKGDDFSYSGYLILHLIVTFTRIYSVWNYREWRQRPLDPIEQGVGRLAGRAAQPGPALSINVGDWFGATPPLAGPRLAVAP